MMVDSLQIDMEGPLQVASGATTGNKASPRCPYCDRSVRANKAPSLIESLSPCPLMVNVTTF